MMRKISLILGIFFLVLSVFTGEYVLFAAVIIIGIPIAILMGTKKHYGSITPRTIFEYLGKYGNMEYDRMMEDALTDSKTEEVTKGIVNPPAQKEPVNLSQQKQQPPENSLS